MLKLILRGQRDAKQTNMVDDRSRDGGDEEENAGDEEEEDSEPASPSVLRYYGEQFYSPVQLVRDRGERHLCFSAEFYRADVGNEVMS